MRLVLNKAQIALATKALATLIVVSLAVTGIVFVIDRPQDFLFPLQADAMRAIAAHVIGLRDTMSADTKPSSLDIVR